MNINTSLPNDLIKSGRELFGERLSKNELKIWFQQEENAFYETGSNSATTDPWYAYIRYVNKKLGYNAITNLLHQPTEVTTLGPGDGTELNDLTELFNISRIHCIEASPEFQKTLKRNFHNSMIIQPRYTGDIDMPEKSTNLFLAYSVLHHIPNVSKVISEASRVLKKNGILIIREPCSSMGMWGPDRSATPNERGIPRKLIMEYCDRCGLEIIGQPVPILLEPINKFLKKPIGYKFIPFYFIYLLDRFASSLVSVNDHYWRDSTIKKMGPSAYFYIFKKL